MGWQQTVCFSLAEKKRKERLYSLGPFSGCFEIQSHGLRGGLRAGVSWQGPNNGLHLLWSYCVLGLGHESSLVILIAMLGGRWWCDFYFIDEKTGIERLIDLLEVTHPVSDPCRAIWSHRCGSHHKAILLIVEKSGADLGSRLSAPSSWEAIGKILALGPDPVLSGWGAALSFCSHQMCLWLMLLAFPSPHPGYDMLVGSMVTFWLLFICEINLHKKYG